MLPAGRSPARQAAGAALFFVAATVLMTWPQAAHLGDRLNDLWDAKQNAWILDWDFRQTLANPADLFQAPILHPARYALAFSENLYGGAIFGFPLLALGVPILVNYNLVFLFALAFSGWSAWLLARYVTGDALASLAAGIVYAFVPWRFSQLPHINMQLGGFLCLLFLFLLRYLDHGRRRDLALFAACFAGNLLSTFHFGLFSGFLIAVVLLFEAFAGPEARRRIPAVITAAGAATILCLPFLIPYAIAARLYGMQRVYREMWEFSARPSDLLSAGYRNRLYGELTQRWTRAEGDLFPGALALLLAAGAAPALARSRSRRYALFVAVGTVGLLVAAGAHTFFYRFLFVHVGSVFRAIRVPSRAIVLCHAALGVLAAWGLSLATRNRRTPVRLGLVGAALLGLIGEYRAFPLELHRYDASTRPVDAWLRTHRGASAVLEYPLGFPYDCEAMLRQAWHRHPLVNGHQSYFPPDYRRLVEAVAARPIPPGVWDQIEALDAKVLIFHPEEGETYERVRYRRFLREGLEANRLRLLRAFPQGEDPTFVFALGREREPSHDASDAVDVASRRELDAMLAVLDADLAPPKGLIQVPAEGQTVVPGFWVYGWAVDDSGIARVEAATERGPAGLAQYGTKWPKLEYFFPNVPNPGYGGWGFPVPPLPPGDHVLKVTLVARDGGRTVLERRIRIVVAPP